MKTVRVIGFANEYYTLWDITTDVSVYGTQGSYKSFQTIRYTYLQNLSKDLDSAIEKAKQMGATCLEPDHELYGRNGSWECQKRLDSKLPNNLSPFFEFGKYQDKLISEIQDVSYMFWYYNESKNRYAKNILIANGYRELGFSLVTQEKYDEAMNTEMVNNILRQEKFIDVDADGNLKLGDGIAYKAFNYMGVNINFIFNQFKEMFYQGFSYALPLVNGNAKKIKGKKIRLYFEIAQEGFRIEYLVNKVEILN